MESRSYKQCFPWVTKVCYENIYMGYKLDWNSVNFYFFSLSYVLALVFSFSFSLYERFLEKKFPECPWPSSLTSKTLCPPPEPHSMLSLSPTGTIEIALALPLATV